MALMVTDTLSGIRLGKEQQGTHSMLKATHSGNSAKDCRKVLTLKVTATYSGKICQRWVEEVVLVMLVILALIVIRPSWSMLIMVRPDWSVLIVVDAHYGEKTQCKTHRQLPPRTRAPLARLLSLSRLLCSWHCKITAGTLTERPPKHTLQS